MKKENILLPTAMTHGAIMGLVLIIFSVFMYMLEVPTTSKVNWLSYIIIIGGIYLGQKNYRDKQMNGSIRYGQALGYAVLMSVFAGILVGIYQLILNKFIDPGLIERQFELAEEMYLNQGYTEAQVDQMIGMSRRFTTPVGLAFMSTLGFAIMGLIFALITSIFIKKEGDGFSAAMEEIEDKD